MTTIAMNAISLRAHARIAGAAFLLYIVTGISSLMLMSPVAAATGTAAKLAALAEHAGRARLTILFGVLMFAYALTLGVSLYALTRDEDQPVALLACCCRVAEGIMGSVGVLETLALLWLATGAGAAALDATSADHVATVLFRIRSWNPVLTAIPFAFGSTLFAWLFVRARSIPRWLAWTGVVASVLLVVVLPLQLAGWVSGPVTAYVWAPMALFEIVLAVWLIAKGTTGTSRAPDPARA